MNPWEALTACVGIVAGAWAVVNFFKIMAR